MIISRLKWPGASRAIIAVGDRRSYQQIKTLDHANAGHEFHHYRFRLTQNPELKTLNSDSTVRLGFIPLMHIPTAGILPAALLPGSKARQTFFGDQDFRAVIKRQVR